MQVIMDQKLALNDTALRQTLINQAQHQQISLGTLQRIRNEPAIKANKNSEQFHMANVIRRVNNWVSPTYLTYTQLDVGLNYHELCIFLFTLKMSRGYEDERVILQVFLMFLNRANLEGKYGSFTYDHTEMDSSRMSVSDLYVFLVCALNHHDKQVLEGYSLYDRSGAKGRAYRLKLLRDFQQFHLIVSVF